MNNNISVILNVVLLIAVAVLYYLHFAGGKQVGTSLSSSSSPDAGVVVFINTDTLMANYEFFEDVQKELEEKRGRAEKQLMTRGQKFQEELVSTQRRAQAGMLTPNQIEAAQRELAQKEQEIMAYRETVAAGLMEEEKILNNRLYDSLVNFLKTYNKDKGYKYILGYSKGGTILLGEEQLDITKDVLNGLNKKYKTDKTSGTSNNE